MTCPDCERMREALERLREYIEAPRSDPLYCDLTGVRFLVREALAPASEPKAACYRCRHNGLLNSVCYECVEFSGGKPASEPPAVPAPVSTPPVDEDAVVAKAAHIIREHIKTLLPHGTFVSWGDTLDVARAAIAALGDPTARDRFLSVYVATVAVQWAAHVREGRGLDEDSIRRFIEEARALAEWTEEVQR
jgi:hypothetical protein